MNTSPTQPDNSLSANVPSYLSKENIDFLDNINSLIIGYDPKINATKALIIADIIYYKSSTTKNFNVYVLGTDKSGATGYLLRNMSMQHLKARGIGAGSIARWILEIANVPIKEVYLGKPSDHINDYMKNNYIKEDKSKYLMIGDTVDTDMKFGKDLDIHTLLVLSGSTTPELLNFSDFLIKNPTITDANNSDLPISIKQYLTETTNKLFDKKIKEFDNYKIKKPTYIFQSLKKLSGILKL
uniref:Haloacid dehalogenase-like hydrolase n=1 Tax=viral metagenome TaxID=1070528 RepID=A0A6C0EHI5_9ZZZZ